MSDGIRDGLFDMDRGNDDYDRHINFHEYQKVAHETAVYDRIFTESQVFQIIGFLCGELEALHDVEVPLVKEAAEKAMGLIGNAKITYAGLGLAGEAGEVAEKLKKLLRDDEGFLTADRRQALEGELGDVMWYLAEVATQAGLDLGLIAKANVVKLRSRKDRGVLGGSGDNR